MSDSSNNPRKIGLPARIRIALHLLSVYLLCFPVKAQSGF